MSSNRLEIAGGKESPAVAQLELLMRSMIPHEPRHCAKLMQHFVTPYTTVSDTMYTVHIALLKCKGT